MKCMKNSNLAAAKRAKNDEFYTCREDIEVELAHYAELFRGKTVYCNCDDPDSSEFWRFFQRNFNAWGLKRLIATHYEPDVANYSYMIEMNLGDAWDGTPVRKPIQSNGDFRSAACIELLEQADIVVTNPPFSLFREYVAQLMEYDKKFLIIGNINVITYKEIFPLIKNNQIWPGFNEKGGTRKGNTLLFGVPDTYESKSLVVRDGKRYMQVSAWWFTNLDHKKRHQPLDLRGVYYDPDKYPRYDNYDAIEVSKTADIPCDYYEAMGVPITFLDKFCPEQFEIVGADFQLAEKIVLANGKTGTGRFYVTRERERAFVLTVGHSKDEVIEWLRKQGVSDDSMIYRSGVMGVPITFLDKYCPEQFEIIVATESEGRGFSAGLWDETSGVSQPLIHGQRRYKRLFVKRK